MSGIIPIPTTRISTALLSQRLTQQVQSDQLDLFRLQQQISTGQRIILPSDDAPAALRAITLQRLLERKEQIQSNVASGQKYLGATDGALSEVADALNRIKSATLGVVGTVASQSERDAAITEINNALSTLVGLGNRQVQGRYLFAGSQTSQLPYSFDGDNVIYFGDDRAVRNYSDIGVLFDTNATGQAVFGGISEAVQGSADLDPELNFNTQLGSLRGGRGIKPNGSIAISDGTSTSIIDLSNAATIGDVVRLIEENPPTGQAVEVQLSGTGIDLSFASGSNIIVTEVGNGTTARELGILEENGTLVRVGDDLDPKLLKTSQLDTLLGTKARTVIESGVANDNADILLAAGVNGADLNGVTVQFVDDSLLTALSGLSAGNEVAEYDASARAASAAISFAGTNNDLILQANAAGVSFNNVRVDISSTAGGGVPTASYDSIGKVLSINLEADGSSDGNQVIAAIAGLAGNPFTASLDSSVDVGNDGSGTIATVSQTNFANTGNSGGDAKTLYVRIDPDATTANDAIAAINTEGTFTATVDLSDSANAAVAGTGIVNLSATAVTSGGSGVAFDKSAGIRIVNGGETYDIDFDTAETVEDLLNTLNSSGAGLEAEINADGTGINVRSRLSGHPLQIGELGGQTATQLGIRTLTGTTQLSDLNYGVGVPTKLDSEINVSATQFSITAGDGQTFVVDLTGVTTLVDARDAVNLAATNNGVSVSAALNAAGDGIELTDNSGGTERLTSSQLGTANSFAGGIDFTLPTDDFSITASDGQYFRIDVGEAKTVNDVINTINAATGGAVTAQLAATGNGIQLIDSTGGPDGVNVTALDGSQAAEYLGLIPAGATESIGSTTTLTGTDQNFLETDSVFNTLISLREALEANDLPAIERAAAKINNDISRVTSARAEVGARNRGLDLSLLSLEDEEIQLRAALSEEIDVDLVEAISELTSRQISLEASLQVSANLLQLTLLNFI